MTARLTRAAAALATVLAPALGLATASGPAHAAGPTPAPSSAHSTDPAHTTDHSSAHPTAPAHGTAQSTDQATDQDPLVTEQLATARAATAKYRFLPFAAADGYDAHMCLARDQGGMGFHYFNESRFGSLDPAKPAGLLYEAGDDGRRRLVGVEWVVPVSESKNTRPRMFGQDFQGPMPGHYPGMPTHYDLHVWLYKNNPNGLFSQWNPTVKCPSS